MIVTEQTIKELETLRKEHLESDIISLISDTYGLSPAQSMNLYFSSRLCTDIAEGKYGIEQLDAHYLVDDMHRYEPELFADLK
ncbi:hypothetical protein BLEM_2046 [Bifidobacterium lemurum]|uniref:Uncharacterized protein n=1 Tax=Bifidobacterium lemurum TaxID=1603886 RepID=A0A261FMR1_9BIFI|nr:hypothetical protein [Bifidobacterium lemurum]OZG60106.1 hypothetical protein BLEM_2046 [Bifidobacterium lemurum]QOL34045.1 hypothetical protein BL8807_09900 [Bifidobacterium lemurum]